MLSFVSPEYTTEWLNHNLLILFWLEIKIFPVLSY